MEQDSSFHSLGIKSVCVKEREKEMCDNNYWKNIIFWPVPVKK